MKIDLMPKIEISTKLYRIINITFYIYMFCGCIYLMKFHNNIGFYVGGFFALICYCVSFWINCKRRYWQAILIKLLDKEIFTIEQGEAFLKLSNTINTAFLIEWILILIPYVPLVIYATYTIL
jgi:uncharacterized membrane protein YjjP (DUF1212 family)